MSSSARGFLCVFPFSKLSDSRQSPAWLERIATWAGTQLEELGSGLLYGYSRFCAATSRIWIAEADVHHLRAAEKRLEPWVVTFWHEDFLLWPIVAQYAHLPWTVWIHNDTFGGRLIQGFCRKAGQPSVELVRKSGRKEKLEAMAGALRAKGRIGIAADYGHPWFKVHPTASQLARQTNGVVLAVHISAPSNPRIGKGNHRLRLPVPFSRYEVRASPWIDPVEHGGDRQTIQCIESKLWSLQSGRLLKAGGKPRPNSSISSGSSKPTDTQRDAIVQTPV
jgi:lysophospholipid acyltransferase (LPLAT)-like uncharacterized protein